MIAPAWPIVLPGGALNPAMYATTGFDISVGDEARRLLLLVAADLADHDDDLGLRVGLELRSRTSMKDEPTIGSPPIPTIVELPSPSPVSSWPIW